MPEVDNDRRKSLEVALRRTEIRQLSQLLPLFQAAPKLKRA